MGSITGKSLFTETLKHVFTMNTAMAVTMVVLEMV